MAIAESCAFAASRGVVSLNALLLWMGPRGLTESQAAGMESLQHVLTPYVLSAASWDDFVVN